jgi:hypothetical protein
MVWFLLRHTGSVTNPRRRSRRNAASTPKEMPMKRMYFGALMLATMWAAASAPGHAQSTTVTLAGSGSGAFETPALANGAVATATCTMNRTSVEFACSARVHNIVDLTAAHIHVGGPGVSGPVLMDIPGIPLRSSDDFSLSWTWREANLTLRPAQGILKMADVFEACSSGNCYLNFHSTQNPGGEIRIQMCPQGAEGRGANGFYSINVCVPDK